METLATLAYFMFLSRTKFSASVVSSAQRHSSLLYFFLKCTQISPHFLYIPNSLIFASFFHISWFISTCYMELICIPICLPLSNRISMRAAISLPCFKSLRQWGLQRQFKNSHICILPNASIPFTAFLQSIYHHLTQKRLQLLILFIPLPPWESKHTKARTSVIFFTLVS